jgi:DUF2934 family protein
MARGEDHERESALPDKAISNLDPRIIEERIRARAYQLFEERGREAGRDWENWFHAEEEITARMHALPLHNSLRRY